MNDADRAQQRIRDDQRRLNNERAAMQAREYADRLRREQQARRK